MVGVHHAIKKRVDIGFGVLVGMEEEIFLLESRLSGGYY